MDWSNKYRESRFISMGHKMIAKKSDALEFILVKVFKALRD